ncbi:MAG: hypothetical protein WBC91_26495 [Phototrophicaceae bacterium]
MSSKRIDSVCVMCGSDYIAKSSKSRYCSDSCKSAYHRLKKSNLIHAGMDSILQTMRDMIDAMENNPEIFMSQGILAFEKMSQAFEKNLPLMEGVRCLRSGQTMFTRSTAKKCDFCDSAYKNSSDKGVKSRYNSACRYTDIVFYDRNDFNINLSGYDAFKN